MIEQNCGQDASRQGEIVTLVESQPDHECSMMCCGKATSQQQVDYRLSFQKKRYRFPGIWAAVCEVQPNDHILVDPQLGESLLAIIYSDHVPRQITPIQRLHLPEGNI